MFKIIGAAAVIIAAGLIGCMKYSEFCERKRILCVIRDGAEKIRSNLKCMCMPLYECFLYGGEFFEKAAEFMGEGDFPSVAVKTAAGDIRQITKEEKECIHRFADGLSAKDCEGQIRNTEIFLTELERHIEKASGELNTKGKLFLKGSFLIAAALVLILI